MRINQNISAVIVNDQLLRNENSLSESVKKLSSGFKFNSARDNPSGVAISYKMQSQIKALERASTNATDGTSMVQTIDGSMGEMMEVLQRTRELCVQAANDTNGPEDRAAIQEEIAALKEEVDRISSDTEYNGMNLLDGTLDRRTYITAEIDDGTGTNTLIKASMFDKVTNVIISDSVQVRDYKVEITGAPTKEKVEAGNIFANGTATIPVKGSVYINGAEAVIEEGMTADEALEAIRDAAETGWVDVDTTADGRLVFEAEKYGSEGKVEISFSSADIEQALGLGNLTLTKGEDVQVSIDDPDPANTGKYEGYSGQATARTSGNHVVITDKSGFEISFEVTEDILVDGNTVLGSRELTIQATDMGILQLQIGANEDQELAVRVPVLNTRSMYIDDLDVTKIKGADKGMNQMDKAIEILSAARSKMGAYENSLDYTERSLDQTIEDMTNAISKLADVDMAEEMTTYTNASVLTQASISVLAQANDLPQQVLSLLQG